MNLLTQIGSAILTALVSGQKVTASTAETAVGTALFASLSTANQSLAKEELAAMEWGVQQLEASCPNDARVAKMRTITNDLATVAGIPTI